MSATTASAARPFAVLAGELDFQNRITAWDMARLVRFLEVKERDLALYGGDDFAVRALRYEIASR